MSSIRETRKAQIDEQLLALFKELPDYWLTAAEIAPCLNQPQRRISRSALRLSAVGQIESRVAYWTSNRHRIRDRYEFRYRSRGCRLPAWLDPTPPTTTPQCARLVRGRASMLKDESND